MVNRSSLLKWLIRGYSQFFQTFHWNCCQYSYVAVQFISVLQYLNKDIARFYKYINVACQLIEKSKGDIGRWENVHILFVGWQSDKPFWERESTPNLLTLRLLPYENLM